MISTEAALANILNLCTPLGHERISLAEASGRVLAAPLRARLTQPPFAASAMDGYALTAGEVAPGARFRVIGESAAGAGFPGRVGAGEAVRIFTGAPLPDGADRVVIQEDTIREGDHVTLTAAPGPGAHIREAGGDFREGDAFEAPCRLTPARIALLAAMNHGEVEVTRRPEIALIATGNELVAPGEVPGADQIIASNAFGLRAMLEAQGARARLLPIARDTPEALGAVLDMAQDSDMIVTIGGASVGDHDLVAQVAGARGLELDFHKVAMRPGKPLMSGRLRGTRMVGLPGNPVSAMICGHIFLRPAVDAMLGLAAAPLPRLEAVLGCALAPNGPREHYMRARLDDAARDTAPVVHPYAHQDSAFLSVLAAANALTVRPPGDARRAAGERIEVIRL